MEKHTGGTFVAINKPGGGYTIPINHLYEKAKPDGLSISMVDTGTAVVAQLFKMENCRFDLTKMNYIANVCTPIRIAVVRPDSPYQSVADLLAAKEPVVALATGPNTQTGVSSKVILGTVLGIPSKVVTGYKSAPTAYKAVVQKEGDISMGLYAAAAGLINAGELKVPFVWAHERFKVLPDVPTIYEELDKLGKLTPEAKSWLDVTVGLFELSRGVITAPDVPAERVKYLRDTMVKVLDEKKIKGNMAKLGYLLYPLSGEETQKRVNAMLQMEASQVEQLKEILAAK